MSTNEQKIYDALLLSAVLELDKYPSKSGQEGTAYFIDDNFVVKELITFNNPSLFSNYQNFENYCKELSEFYEKGYCIPKIYSWTMLPKEFFEDGKTPLSFDRYYILEERIHGKELYIDRESNIYDMCTDFCSKEEFDKAVWTKEGLLFKKIAETYLGHFIKTNEQVASLSDANLDNFILTDYDMSKNQHYGMVDVHPGNVLFDGTKLTIIDNGFVENLFEGADDSKLAPQVLNDLLYLLAANERGFRVYGRCFETWPELKRLKNELNKTSKAAISRCIKSTNKMLNPVYSNGEKLLDAQGLIKDSVQTEADYLELMSLINRQM